MKLLVQRVKNASVTVNQSIVGKIEGGVLVFVGITHTDTKAQVEWLANKLINLRLFEDDQGKLNLSLLDTQRQVLIVSQFTLYGDCSAGRRPSFTEAAPPPVAIPLYEQFIAEVEKSGLSVETGTFGAMMQVSLVNDGPITLMIEKN